MIKKQILSSFGIRTPKDLIGRILEVSFWSDADDCHYSMYFQIDTFTLRSCELAFPPKPFDQGGKHVQVSVFEGGEFHIVLINDRAKSHKPTEDIEAGYYHSSKRYKSKNIKRGKIKLV